MRQEEALNALYQEYKKQETPEESNAIDLNKLIVLKDCLYYEGKHKYYIFQFEQEYTLMTDADKEITVCRAKTLTDVIGYVENIELGREVETNGKKGKYSGNPG